MADPLRLRPVSEQDLPVMELLIHDPDMAGTFSAHTTAHRIEAATEAGNIAEQKALEKAGFTREGVLRGTGWRDGAWRDGVIYGILRTDPAGY